MYSLLLVVQVLVALALIGLILIQHGRGADVGAAFGSGASGTVFGARGSASFLSRSTAALATVFFLNSLGLAFITVNASRPTSVLERVEVAPPMQPADVMPEPTPSRVEEDVPSLPADVPVVPGE